MVNGDIDVKIRNNNTNKKANIDDNVGDHSNSNINDIGNKMIKC